MSLKATLRSAVDTVFNAVGDLAVLATLSSRKVTEYDFASRGVVSTASSQKVEVILLTTQKPTGDGYTTSVIMKSGPDLSVYDTLTVNGVVYNITDYSDNDYAIEATVVRER